MLYATGERGFGAITCTGSFVPCVTYLTDPVRSPTDLCAIEQLIVMKPNMGSADRLIRVVIAAVIAVLYLAGVLQGTWGIVLLALAAVFALTAMVRFCPLYLPFVIRTNKDR